MKKKILAIILASLMIFAMFAGCAKNPVAEDPTGNDPSGVPVEGSFEFTLENYPKMGGSLANLPLGEAVTALVLGISREEANGLISFTGSTTDNYVALANGEFDILIAYEPSEEAKQFAKDLDFEWEMTPIGRDALVFIVNSENPTENLTIDQIKDIYTGKITKWSELGVDSDSDIIPYQRNSDSGSQTLFDKLINLGDDLMEAPSEYIVGSMIGLLEVIANFDNSKDALGYTVYYYLTNMETQKLSNSKILSVDGVEPSNETIKSGDYPLTNDFYVVIPKGTPDDDPARILYNFIVSEQGKQIAENENYVTVD